MTDDDKMTQQRANGDKMTKTIIMPVQPLTPPTPLSDSSKILFFSSTLEHIIWSYKDYV